MMSQKFKLKLKDEFGMNIFKGKDTIDKLDRDFTNFLRDKGMLNATKTKRRRK